jgi:hypothetical protein
MGGPPLGDPARLRGRTVVLHGIEQDRAGDNLAARITPALVSAALRTELGNSRIDLRAALLQQLERIRVRLA